MRNLTISKRDIKIKYGIDKESVSSLCKEYDITGKEMKEVIRQCGLAVRKNDNVEEEIVKTNITLID